MRRWRCPYTSEAGQSCQLSRGHGGRHVYSNPEPSVPDVRVSDVLTAAGVIDQHHRWRQLCNTPFQFDHLDWDESDPADDPNRHWEYKTR